MRTKMVPHSKRMEFPMSIKTKIAALALATLAVTCVAFESQEKLAAFIYLSRPMFP